MCDYTVLPSIFNAPKLIYHTQPQAEICSAIEELDGEGKFKEDAWIRESGGGGISRVLAGGKVFEKAGVNLSVVYGSMPQEALKAATERGVDRAKGNTI